MLTSHSQYERAVREVARLDGLIREGAATDEDRHRHDVGADLCLIWEWAQEGRRLREANERAWNEYERQARSRAA